MTATVTADRAAAQAEAAAGRAGVEVRSLGHIDDVARLDGLFASVWGPRGNAFVPLEILQAFRLAGNYVVGAYAGDRLVAGGVAFLGEHGGRLHLHSHIVGVVPDLQGRAVGYAVKLHQRAWCLARGVDEVIWTFDPLIRRNAYFNLEKLRTRVVGYEERFYGDALDDAVNAGDDSDRAVVSWPLSDPEVVAAADGDTPPAGDASLSGEVILRPGDGDEPVATPVDAAGATLRAWVPPDIVTLRRQDPELGRAWRVALRRTVGRAVRDGGYVGVGMSRDGWYTLVPDAVEGR
jgi:predicted GNAT superfamily acetyltransferase